MKNRRTPSISHLLQTVALGALLGAAWPASAQIGYSPTDNDIVEWKEDATPPPPAYSDKNLIDIEMPSGSSVKMGLDPSTISVNRETGIIRYVVVARGPSAVNAMYEGIRCDTGEYRVYARQTPGNDWSFSSDSEWKNMRGQLTYPHPYRLARDGLCLGKTVNQSEREMVRALKSPKGTLYDQ